MVVDRGPGAFGFYLRIGTRDRTYEPKHQRNPADDRTYFKTENAAKNAGFTHFKATRHRRCDQHVLPTSSSHLIAISLHAIARARPLLRPSGLPG